MKKKRPPTSGGKAPGTDDLPAGTKWIPSATAKSDSTLKHLVYSPQVSRNFADDSSGGPPGPPSMAVEFDVVAWNPTTTDAVGYKTSKNATGTLLFHAPSPTGRDLFEVNARVRVRTNSTTPIAESNAKCAQWTAEVIQNIIAFGSRKTVYEESVWTTTIEEVPCLDHDLGAGASKDFSAADQTVELHVGDTPGFSGGTLCFDNVSWVTAPPNPLTQADDDVTFITWLTVHNRHTGERRFLRWVKWKTKWKLNITVPPNANLPQPAPTATWQRELIAILGGGVGEGTVRAVFNKRKDSMQRTPPNPPQPP